LLTLKANGSVAVVVTYMIKKGRPMKDIGPSGSLRLESLKARLLESVASKFDATIDYGVVAELDRSPFCDCKTENDPLVTASGLRGAVGEADMFSIGLPEYHNPYVAI
jgi:NAD(P)H-dependent FMN reductase